MRLAIVGSTSLVGNEVAVEIVDRVLSHYRPDVVVSGGANGIDTMAANAARLRGIHVVEYLPTVPRWRGEGGFRERNIKIAAGCDRLVRIADDESKTYGSGWTRDRARQRGVPTEEYLLRPDHTYLHFSDGGTTALQCQESFLATLDGRGAHLG